MPIFADNNMSFLTFCALWLIPGWRDVLAVDVPEKIRRLKDPAVRAKMLEDAADVAACGGLADFGHYLIGDVFSAENEPYRNRKVADIAAEQGEDPFTDHRRHRAPTTTCKTVLWPHPGGRRPTPTGSCAASCGRSATCSSAAPTPAPTSTACWARPTRRASSPTASGAASWSRSSGRCS